tara:strand:+ start:2974 stop:3123 length:150 start_codon:yes stop_codon:yes gene_type:complete
LVYEEDPHERKKKREKGGEQKLSGKKNKEEECRHKKIYNFTQASGHRKR